MQHLHCYSVQLPNSQTAVIPKENVTTSGDLIRMCCSKRVLDPGDHFLMLLTEDNGMIGEFLRYTQDGTKVEKQKFPYVSIVQRFVQKFFHSQPPHLKKD